MSLRHSIAILLAAQFLAADFASAALQTGGFEQTGLSGVSTTAAYTGRLVKGQWYSLNRTTVVQPMEQAGGESNYNAPNGPVTLVQDMEVNVMDLSADGAYALIGIDDDTIAEANSDIDGNEPVLMWVSVADLTSGRLEMVDTESEELLAGMNIELEQNQQISEADEYVDDIQIASSRKTKVRKLHRGRGKTRKHTKGMTYCLRDVRLTAARFTRKVPQGIESASRAYGPYKAAGWKPVKYSKDNKIGTACFFGGGRTGCHGYCGHAAIKIGANAWKGAGIRPTPFLKGRHLIGCLVPPGR